MPASLLPSYTCTHAISLSLSHSHTHTPTHNLSPSLFLTHKRIRAHNLFLSLPLSYRIPQHKQTEEVLEALEAHQAELQSMSQVDFFKDKARFFDVVLDRVV